MTRNVVTREQLRARRVECPLCRRQIAAPAEHLIVYGTAEVTVENADAIECPACGGVTFVVDEAGGTE